MPSAGSQGQLQENARAQTESRGSHEDLQLRGARVLYRWLRAATRKTRQAKRQMRIDPRLDSWRSPSPQSKVPPSAEEPKAPSTVGELAHWASLARIMIFRKPQGPGEEPANYLLCSERVTVERCRRRSATAVRLGNRPGRSPSPSGGGTICHVS
jgi:hypothetical protein